MKRNYKHILFPFVLCGLMAAQTSAAPGIVKGRITDTQRKTRSPSSRDRRT